MKKIFYPLVVLFLALAVRPALAVEPMFKLTPSRGTYTKGSSVEIILGVDSGSVETQAFQARIKFDPAKVKIETAVPVDNLLETLGVEFLNADFTTTSGILTASFYPDFEVHPSQKAIVKGDLLKIKFVPLIAGTVNLDFDCQAGDSSESSIYDGTSTLDMINCPSNINGEYTITDGGTANPDPTAVPTTPPNNPTATPTTANNELPKTGSVETTIGLLIFGFVSLLSSLALKFL